MIHSLTVENIALIDRLHMEFAGGLNVMTGETGAGKSIIVGAISLVLGERADREMIRSGKDSAHVEAVLYLDAKVMEGICKSLDIPIDEELIISRELSAEGKNICRINGITVTLSTLKTIMQNTVDLLGQHEHQSLLYPQNHLDIIDSFGDGKIAVLKSKIAAAYATLEPLEKQLGELGGSKTERLQKIDFLEFQLNELEKAGLQQGEEAALKEERAILANAQNISQALRHCYDLLYAAEDGLPAISALKYCVDDMAAVEAFSTEYANIAEQLREHYYALEETAHEVNRLADAVSFDEQRQEEVEERLEYISALKRKYGAADIDALIDMQEGFQAELDRLHNSEALSRDLSSKISDVKDTLYGLYTELSAIRRKTAAALSTYVVKELKSLGMENAQFEARFAELPPQQETVFTKDGIDTVEFYISTNAGEPLRPLAKTASGGEISRIMLAFKSVTAKVDKISTMVFDEIDTGISGMTAHVVAEKMAAIAKHRQIICVTHLPQIAAMADRNFFISKSSAKNATNTNIQALAGDEVTDEIARLSGGAGSQNAAAYARELIEKAHDAKERIER